MLLNWKNNTRIIDTFCKACISFSQSYTITLSWKTVYTYFPMYLPIFPPYKQWLADIKIPSTSSTPSPSNILLPGTHDDWPSQPHSPFAILAAVIGQFPPCRHMARRRRGTKKKKKKKKFRSSFVRTTQVRRCTYAIGFWTGGAWLFPSALLFLLNFL